MKGGLDTLVLRLTNRCNLACGYCYAGSGPAGEDLSPERAAEAVALACPPGGALCGGGCPAARRAGPSPLDCQMHRRMLEHACRLEGKLEWWNT
ncbi:hypothetical protein ADH75_01415 [Flavonifractor plautii]|uniref:Uncharacterized protein n=1 Tax=Flavonifractor plautii TaxID=292800 RepID=A0AAX1KFA8_FLAPL|nr:hypothetical protein [Flavonifractor plautii]ANU42475.1 hypothetical protein A4U99_15965 [Flavonifractor plautii]OXE48262.1 hypothetical protein ADH75_01415 [Flavonifractor plautii]QQR04626.1 hypothetical protein I5Q84_11590 [Flavonifractor plautii]UQA25424.1 hypothetical protein M2853_12005 [Flavonifractor plautii]